MIFDALTIYNAQQRAKEILTTPFKETTIFDNNGQVIDKKQSQNEFYVDPFNVIAPVVLIQEQAYVNTTNQFTFDFTWNAPQPGPTLNNVVLPKNNVAAIYGLQLLIGQGDAANIRQYNAYGPAANDNAVYNSQISMQIESSKPVAMIEGQQFKNVYTSPTQYDQWTGLVLIEPVRVLTGEMGVFQLVVSLKNSISAVVLTPGLWLSARLVCVMGQASAKAR